MLSKYEFKTNLFKTFISVKTSRSLITKAKKKPNIMSLIFLWEKSKMDNF